MATCQSCDNLLPGRIDQCPVCGHQVAYDLNAVPEFQPPAAPGWVQARRAPAAKGDQTERPARGGTEPQPWDPGLGGPARPDASNEDTQVRKSGDTPTDPSAVPSEPAADPTADISSDELPTADIGNNDIDGASLSNPLPVSEPRHEDPLDFLNHRLPDHAEDEQEPTVISVPPGRDLSSGQPALRGDTEQRPISEPAVLSPSETTEVVQVGRAADSFSTRLDGRVLLGRRRQHIAITTGAAILGSLALLVGAVTANDAMETFESQRQSQHQTTDVEGLLAQQELADNAKPNMVEIRTSGCDQEGQAVGIAVGPDLVISSFSTIQNDTAPTVVATNGERFASAIVGVDLDLDLALLRTTRDLASDGFAWSSSGQALPGSELSVVSLSRGSARAASVTVLDRTRSTRGVISTMRVDPGGLDPSLAAIDHAGRLVGMTSTQADRVIAAETLQEFVSEFQLSPVPVTTICRSEASGDATDEG